MTDTADKARVVREMFDRIAPRYDLVNRVISLGLDMRWRKQAVGMLGLPPGSLVLDLACGTGDFCRAAERAGHRVVGVDFAAGMLRVAHTDAPLVEADILTLPMGDRIADGITCGFALRNVADVGTLVDEMARVARPGGRIALLDVSTPGKALLRAGHRLWFDRAVPVLGAVFSDPEAYRYLPRSVIDLPPRPTMLAMLGRAGFTDARWLPLSGGVVQLFLATRS